MLPAVILLCMAPKHSAELLSSVPKGKKVVMCFTENIHVLDKLRQTRVIMLLALSPILMNNTYLKNCLSTETHKTKLGVHLLTPGP